MAAAAVLSGARVRVWVLDDGRNPEIAGTGPHPAGRLAPPAGMLA